MKTMIGCCRLLLALVLAAPASAASYPDRPIHLVVPFPAGGPTDILAKMIAPQLKKNLGQNVVINHRSGRNGVDGAAFVAKAPHDGYTLLLTPSSFAIHPGTYRKLPYDTEKAFAPVSLLAASPFALVVNPSLPAYSVRELVTYAKGHPGKLTYATGGAGGPTQLVFALFAITTGIQAIQIPYEGAELALVGVAAGEAEAMMAPILVAAQSIRDGRVRGIAVTGKHPSPVLPDLPTIDSDLPGFTAATWYAVLAPAGTPAGIVRRLSRALDRIVHLPETKKDLDAIGGEPVGGPPGLLADLLHDEIQRWIRVAKETGVAVAPRGAKPSPQ
jgi:tripartite-type tricarboxylate transporter receptor subunit TctC